MNEETKEKERLSAKRTLTKIGCLINAPYLTQEVASRRDRINELIKQATIHFPIHCRVHGDEVHAWTESLEEHGRFEVIPASDWTGFCKVAKLLDIELIKHDIDED